MNFYQTARRIEITPDGWLAIARAHQALDQPLEALGALEAAAANTVYPLPHVRLAEQHLALGQTEAARQAFAPRQLVPEEAMIAWSWRFLRPLPVTTAVQIGAGLDFGWFNGLYAAESAAGQTWRWSGPQAELRVPIGAQGVLLIARAPRPTTSPVRAELCVAQTCQAFTLTSEWQALRLLLPQPLTADATLQLHSETFVAEDGRELGLQLSFLQVLPLAR